MRHNVLCLLFVQYATSSHVVSLNSAATYAILAGSTVANTGLTILNGDVGLYPGTAATGFPPGLISQGYALHIADTRVSQYPSMYSLLSFLVWVLMNSPTQAVQAKVDLAEAMLRVSQLTTGAVWIGGTVDIGGITMYPGLYTVTTTLGILTGDLTLDAQKNSSATFIFKMVSCQILTAAERRQLLTDAQRREQPLHLRLGDLSCS